MEARRDGTATAEQAGTEISGGRACAPHANAMATTESDATLVRQQEADPQHELQRALEKLTLVEHLRQEQQKTLQEAERTKNMRWSRRRNMLAAVLAGLAVVAPVIEHLLATLGK